jgi:hypothetical protein
MSYRLHIDVPINGDEAEALRVAEEIVRFCFNNGISEKRMRELAIEQVNYRLGHDEDRQKSNYFIKSPSGHVNNKKSKITYSLHLTPDEETL